MRCLTGEVPLYAVSSPGCPNLNETSGLVSEALFASFAAENGLDLLGFDLKVLSSRTKNKRGKWTILNLTPESHLANRGTSPIQKRTLP